MILPLLKTDLYAIMQACINGTLADIEIEWHDAYCATVVCAAPGYPESPLMNLEIESILSRIPGQRALVIGDICLVEKRGGKSGVYIRKR